MKEMLCEYVDPKTNRRCNSTHWLQKHHLFSNTKWARRLYGDLLDDDRNIMILCERHHLWYPIPKYTEIDFCQKLGIEIRSKKWLKKKE
jgi:hypothetical protein